jgi:hypothetical protein
MTAKKLVNSLEIVLAVSGPNEALPTAATAFEFLALVNDFAQFMTDRLNAGPRAKELVVNLGTMAMMAFIVAMNVEYGLIDRNDWEFGSSDQSG